MKDLCSNRSASPISLVEQRYNFDLLLGMVKCTAFPHPLRSAACRLLFSTFIDRHPHYRSCGQGNLPFLVWKFVPEASDRLFDGDGGAFPKSVTPQCKSISGESFTELKDFVEAYLTNSPAIVYSDVHASEFTCTIEAVADHLLDMGFFSDRPRVQRLSAALLEILRPSTDTMPDRWAPVAELHLGAEVKVRAIGMLQKLHRYRTNERVGQLVARCRVHLGEARGLEPTRTASAMEGDPSTRLERSLASVLRQSFGRGAAQRLRLAVHEALTGEDHEAFERSVMGGAATDTLMLELMTSDDDDLFEASLGLLLDRHRTVRSLGAALASVTVIPASGNLPVFGSYDLLLKLLLSLRAAFETVDAWILMAPGSRVASNSESDCVVVSNALMWLAIFCYFNASEDAKEASAARCDVQFYGGDTKDGSKPAVRPSYTNLDFYTKMGIPPPWLPDWFLDRDARPAFEQPLKPASVHQAICHGLGLTHALVEALEVGNAVLRSCLSDGAQTRGKVSVDSRALYGLDGEDGEKGESLEVAETRKLVAAMCGLVGRARLNAGFDKWFKVHNPRRSNTQRINEMIENVFHCLSAVIDDNSMAKRTVLESINKVVGVVEGGRATSPRNLVTLCGRLFHREPELCASANRDLLRLLCGYVHTCTECLFRNEFKKCTDDRYNEAFSTREITDSFLVSTLALLVTLCGGHERQPFRANQLFVAATLIPDASTDPVRERFRDFTANPSRRSSSGAFAGSTEQSRVALITLLNVLCTQGGSAAAVRQVLPMSWFIEEISLLQEQSDGDGEGKGTGGSKQTLMDHLLFSVYFNDAGSGGDSAAERSGGGGGGGDGGGGGTTYELVTFAEKLRPLCHQPEGPETKRDLERLRSTMLVLYAFSSAAGAIPCGSPDEATQRVRVGQVAVEAYVALKRWNSSQATVLSTGQKSRAKALRSAAGLAGRIARELVPEILSQQLAKIESRSGDATADEEAKSAAKGDKPAPQAAASHKSGGGKRKEKARMEELAQERPELALEAGEGRGSGDKEAAKEVASLQERAAVEVVFIALQTDTYMQLCDQQQEQNLTLKIRGEFDGFEGFDMSDAPDVGGAGLAPRHPGFNALLSRMASYLARRMKDQSPKAVATKREVIGLLRRHLQIVSEGVPDMDAENEGDSPLDRKIRMTLFPMRARARVFLNDVLEGNMLMVIIMSLVFFGLTYEMVLKMQYGFQMNELDLLLLISMWIYAVEVATKICVHLVAFQTLRKFVTDPFCMLDLTLVTFDLIMYFAFPEPAAGDDDGPSSESSGGSASSARLLKTLKLLKSARALRIVGRAWKIYRARLERAKMSEEQQAQAEALSQELQATMIGYSRAGIPDLLYSIVAGTAESGAADEGGAELARAAYGLAMLLVKQPHNKEAYETLQARSKRDDEERSFFGDAVLWDTASHGLNESAARAHRRQTNQERFERTEADIKQLRDAAAWASKAAHPGGLSAALAGPSKRASGGREKGGDVGGEGAEVPLDAQIDEARALASGLNSVELTEAWLWDIVKNHTAADQELIDSAIQKASAKLEEDNKLPSMSPAIASAKIALLGLRYSEMRAVVDEGKEVILVVLAESVGGIFDASTDVLFFLSTVIPLEGGVQNILSWSLLGQLSTVSVLMSLMNAAKIVYMIAFCLRFIERPELILHTFHQVSALARRISFFAGLFSMYVTTSYVVNPNSVFSVILTVGNILLNREIGKRTKGGIQVKPWMLTADARFSIAQQEDILLSIGGSVGHRILEAVDILKEGGLEVDSKAGIMAFIAGESSRALALADDLSAKLRGLSSKATTAQKSVGPKDLLKLLKSAVRMPRV